MLRQLVLQRKQVGKFAVDKRRAKHRARSGIGQQCRDPDSGADALLRALRNARRAPLLGREYRCHVDAVTERGGQALGDAGADPVVLGRTADIGERDHDDRRGIVDCRGALRPGTAGCDGQDRHHRGHDGAGHGR